MTPRLHETLTLDIVIGRKGLEKDEWASCIPYYTEDNQRPKLFDIHIDPGFGEKKFLTTLAHEMVHMRQFAKAQLYEYERYKKLHRWKTEFVNEEKIWYWFLPWEVECYGMEGGLYHLFQLSESDNAKQRAAVDKVSARK